MYIEVPVIVEITVGNAGVVQAQFIFNLEKHNHGSENEL